MNRAQNSTIWALITQVWWNWAKTYRDLKAQEFLELRQGTMTVLEYVARLKKLARFAINYVATDAAKFRRFENGLKLSIRGKIVVRRPTGRGFYG